MHVNEALRNFFWPNSGQVPRVDDNRGRLAPFTNAQRLDLDGQLPDCCHCLVVDTVVQLVDVLEVLVAFLTACAIDVT